MKIFLTYFFMLFSFAASSQAQISSEDLKTILGEWEGEITYLDYQSNTPFTMAANLLVEQGKNESSLVLNNIYPNEPQANSSDKIKVSKNGSLLNGHKVTMREQLANGQIQVQTEYEGKDDNKKALIRETFVLGKTLFVIRKEVQFTPEADWIKRSEFSYSRKK